jgi:hypothetical protein
MTETIAGIWIAVDAWIEKYLEKHYEDRISLDADRIKDIHDFTGGNLGVINEIGLKRRVGKLLGARGYIKISNNPPIWEYPADKCRWEDIPMWAQNTYRGLIEVEIWTTRAKEQLIKQFPHMDQEARR